MDTDAFSTPLPCHPGIKPEVAPLRDVSDSMLCVCVEGGGGGHCFPIRLHLERTDLPVHRTRMLLATLEHCLMLLHGCATAMVAVVAPLSLSTMLSTKLHWTLSAHTTVAKQYLSTFLQTVIKCLGDLCYSFPVFQGNLVITARNAFPDFLFADETNLSLCTGSDTECHVSCHALLLDLLKMLAAASGVYIEILGF